MELETDMSVTSLCTPTRNRIRPQGGRAVSGETSCFEVRNAECLPCKLYSAEENKSFLIRSLQNPVLRINPCCPQPPLVCCDPHSCRCRVRGVGHIELHRELWTRSRDRLYMLLTRSGEHMGARVEGEKKKASLKKIVRS